MRGKEFPGAHPLNVSFASPILADGKLIVAGGTLEQVVAAIPGYQGLHRPGLRRRPGAEDRPGRLEVRRRARSPSRSIRRSRSRTAWGDHIFYFGPATSSGLVYAVVRRGVGHDLLRHRRQHRAAAADRRRPAAAHARVVRGHRPGRPRRQGAVGHADQSRRRLDQCHAVLRPEGGALQGPIDRRHAQGLHDPRGGQADQGGRGGLQERRLLRPAGRRRAHRGPHAPLHRPADVSARADAGPADARPAQRHRRACRPAARPTAGRSSPTASTPSGSASQETRPSAMPRLMPPTGAGGVWWP